MKYYIEITLLPGTDVALYFLWEKVYQQVHLALVGLKDSKNKVQAGVSFPGYFNGSGESHIGDKLRLFAPSFVILEQLNIHKKMSRLSDYVHLTGIRKIPERIDRHAYFKRIQTKNNNERLARRKAKRYGISLKEALSYYENRKEQYSTAPYIRIRSHSSSMQYRLMIVKIDSYYEKIGDGFSTYGLSTTSTVPLF